MKKVLAISLALVLSLAIAAPVLALPTEVTIVEGDSPPVIKCKWEQDLTANLEDGDPNHQVPGSAFLPPLKYKGQKVVQYWAVVTDEEDNGFVQMVWADVYHPDLNPECGSFKYEVPMHLVDKEVVGKPAFIAAYNAGLIKFNTDFDYAEVMEELNKCTAEIWMGEYYLDYHQPAGPYRVEVKAMDTHDTTCDPLENYFLYVACAAFKVDFTGINYGSVGICQDKWISGDTKWDEPKAMAPDPNPATVCNIGNTRLTLFIRQDDMEFGKTTEGNWNVQYDARLGNPPDNVAVYYWPYQVAEIPSKLNLCSKEELDLSIHIFKADSGATYKGTLTLTCKIDPFLKCTD